MNQTRTTLGRSLSVITASLLLFVISANGLAWAAVGGQVQERSIRMSDNGASGGTISTGVGSGTGVTYRVNFKAASSYTIKGVVLDFCAGTGGTPFVGDPTCGAPPDFTVGSTPTADTSTYQGVDGLGSGWTTSSLNSGQTFRMVNSTGTALTSDTEYTFAISGITNPSVSGSFYARLITYTSDTGAVASYAHGTVGTYQDYGGFALSITNIVQVTAKVQETLVFCMLGTTDPLVPTTAPTACNDVAATAPAITLGHGDNNTLDALLIDKNYVFSIASTNAVSGVTVRIHNANGCGGMALNPSDSTCGIPAVNSGAASTPALPMIAGTAAFGVSIDSNSDVYALPPYDGDPGADEYGFDTTTSGSNVTTTFGSRAIKSNGPINNIINTWTFAATASQTTAAGVYQANLAAVATGTF